MKHDKKDLEVFICILDRVRQFRYTHWSLVVHYILEKTSVTHGSGGSDAVHFIPNQLLAVIDYILDLCKICDLTKSEGTAAIKEIATSQREQVVAQIEKF